MFKGLSTLRKQERKAAPDSEETKKLQAYLSKYTSTPGTCLLLYLRQVQSRTRLLLMQPEEKRQFENIFEPNIFSISMGLWQCS